MTTSVASGAARSEKWRIYMARAGHCALVNVVAGEEAARADLASPRRQVLAHAVAVVARVDVGDAGSHALTVT